jgi:ATP-dependent RNA helicase RhlE
VSSFADLNLLPSLVEGLAEQSIKRPTEIQERAIPILLRGESLIGVAETGSGKTFAFALPLLHRLKQLELDGSAVSEPGRPRGLVVVPGRELGEQVGKVLKNLTHSTRLRVRTALGGSKKQVARQNVSGRFEILVATPGRLTHLLDSRQLKLDDVRTVVLDEADQLLDKGFLPPIRRVVDACPSKAQRVLFSATLPGSMDAVWAPLFPAAPTRIRSSGASRTVPTLSVEQVAVDDDSRFEALRRVLIRDFKVGTLLFCNTRKQADELAAWLAEHRFEYAPLMGEMDRTDRRRSLARFRDGEVNLLLTTDLGGRGLDIERVDRVINVHLPQELDNYLHRAGRTARAGRTGAVINLVASRDRPLVDALRKRQRKR